MQRLLDELDLLPPEMRAAALATREIADARVRSEAESLLAAEAERGDFLEGSPWRDSGPRAPTPALPPGTLLGAFRIETLIGRGGTAEVYRAHRVAEFEQCVAVKVISGDAGTRLDAFQRERRILAALEHPGISRIVDGGITDSGRPYMVMEYVEGTDLIRHARGRGLDLRARLDLFRQVCEAVSFAHRHLVIHRDLKPGNIRVTPEGQVKLLDFGVAKLLRAGVRTGDFETATVLTPEFAAPEQLYGEPVTTATDVYALGVVLFQLLTGVPAFRTEGRPMHLVIDELLRSRVPAPSVVAAAQSHPPLPPRRLEGDLDAIVALATRKKPVERYANADELWADLARHLAHEPVRARRGNTGYRLRRLLRRYRVALLAAGLALIAIGIGVQISLWQARSALRAEQAAIARAEFAERAQRYLVAMLAQIEATEQDFAYALEQSLPRIEAELKDDPRLLAALLLDVAQIRAGQGDVPHAQALVQRAITLLERARATAPERDRARAALEELRGENRLASP